MSGQALIVTGATGGLGPAVVSRLAERGDRLLLTGRDKARLAELAKVYGKPGHIETLATDVSDPAGAREAAEVALAAFGQIDGLVHLVGGFRAGPLFILDLAAYEGMLRDNFLSAVTATQALLPHLGDGGRLVYFSTPLAEEPLPALSAYAAAKAALVAWVRSIAHELKRGGVHANVVSMTMADTPAKRQERPDLNTDHMVAPELVARVVAFLTSAEADGVYGSVVPVLGRFEFTSELSGRPR